MQNLRSVAVEIRQRVSALDAGRKMGLHPDGHGYCRCPFHQEKTGSLRLYTGNRGFYCYGCGANGSVIDLVMRFYGIGFKQALIRLNVDFCLGYSFTDKPMTNKERMDALKRLEAEEAERKRKAIRDKTLLWLYWAWGDLFNLYRDAGTAHRPRNKDEPWDETFAAALKYGPEARAMMEYYAVQAIRRDAG